MTDNLTTDLRFSIIPAWLLASSVSDKAVRLYGVLAGYADSETGQAYPGRTLLSKRLDCSTKTVDRAVAELTELGAIRKQQRVKDGFYQSSLYTVVRIDPASQVSQPRVTGDPTPCHPRPDPVSPVSQRTRTTELEPNNVEPINLKPQALSHSSDAFDSFWTIYPNGSDKPRARREFDKAIKRVSFETILAGAERYRDDPNRSPEFTKHPSTWLHNDSWDNPALPAPAVKARRMTNAEEGALLSQKYREEEQLALGEGNPVVAGQLEADASEWVGGNW
jgi:hypothetical protein